MIATLWLYGAIHVVYSERIGIGTCWKIGWSLSDTFLDYDHELFMREEHDSSEPEKVLEALDKCSLHEDPGAWERDKIVLVFLPIAAIAAWAEIAHRRRRQS